jgi:hypothetical protein
MNPHPRAPHPSSDNFKNKIAQLTKEIQSKDDRIKNLEGDQDTLYISQVAFQFEQAICTYVLPKVFKNDQHTTIKSLLKHLQRGLPKSIADPSRRLLLEGRE